MLYITIIIKLNIAYTTSLLSQFLINFKLKHILAIN
jgi:hypothetical protein